MVAEVGADAVEIDARGDFSPASLSHTGRRQLRKILDEFRLRAAAVSFYPRGSFHDQRELDRRIDATKAAMQLAADLGASVMVTRLGRIPADRDAPERAILIEVLADLGRQGQRVGALLAAKTGTDDPRNLADLIRQLPEFSLGVDLDAGSAAAAGFSPVETAAMLGASILSVHATDARTNSGPPTEYLPLGRGDVDFPALFGALDEQDYRGYFTVGAAGVGDPADEISRSVQFLRRL